MGCSNNTTSTTSGPSPAVTDAYAKVVGNAQNVASQPLQQYAGSLVAGFTPDQYSGFNTTRNTAGITQPYINQATNYYQTSGAPITPLDFTSQNINALQNPYTSDVVNTTQQQFENQNAQRQASIQGDATMHHAYGGDREAVAQGIAAGQEALAQAPVMAGLRSSGYNTSLGEFNALNQAQLSAQQATGWLQQGAGYGLSQLGNQAQNAGYTDASHLLGTGALQQTLAQQGLNIPYEYFTQQQGYPFQTAGWLSNIAQGIGSGMGGTSSTTSPGPSAISQVAGLGVTGLGLAGATGGFGKDGWLTGSNGVLPGGLSGASGWANGVGWGPTAAGTGAGAGITTNLATGVTSDVAGMFGNRGGRIPHGYASGGMPQVPYGLDGAVPDGLGGGVPDVSQSFIPTSPAISTGKSAALQPVTTTTGGGKGGGGILGLLGTGVGLVTGMPWLGAVGTVADKVTGFHAGGRSYADGGLAMPIHAAVPAANLQMTAPALMPAQNVGITPTMNYAPSFDNNGYPQPMIPVPNDYPAYHLSVPMRGGALDRAAINPAPVAALAPVVSTDAGLTPDFSNGFFGSDFSANNAQQSGGGWRGGDARHFDSGGLVQDAGQTASGGANPYTSSSMLVQRYLQYPIEQLQEMAVRTAPSTPQGQAIQRALQMKKMQGGADHQQQQQEPGLAAPSAQAPQGFADGGTPDFSDANAMAQALEPVRQQPTYMGVDDNGNPFQLPGNITDIKSKIPGIDRPFEYQPKSEPTNVTPEVKPAGLGIGTVEPPEGLSDLQPSGGLGGDSIVEPPEGLAPPKTTPKTVTLNDYTPAQVAMAKSRGMMMSNGLPSFPPGSVGVNSRGEPYSPAPMTSQERANDTASYKFARANPTSAFASPSTQPAAAPTLAPLALPSTPLSIPSPTRNLPQISAGEPQQGSGLSGNYLSMGQAKQLLIDRGMPPDKASIGAAIIMAESGGNIYARNEKGEHSYGLSQINEDAWPGARSAYGNPTSAADWMVKISHNGENFRDWSAFKSGAYQRFLPEAERATGAPLPSPDSVMTARTPSLASPPPATPKSGETGIPALDRATHQDNRGFGSSPWMPVIAAGLGMMASRNPHPLSAIGEGGLSGVKTAMTQEELSNKHALSEIRAQAIENQAKHYAELATYHSAENDRKTAYGQENLGLRAAALTAQMDAKQALLGKDLFALEQKAQQQQLTLTEQQRWHDLQNENKKLQEQARSPIKIDNAYNDATGQMGTYFVPRDETGQPVLNDKSKWIWQAGGAKNGEGMMPKDFAADVVKLAINDPDYLDPQKKQGALDRAAATLLHTTNIATRARQVMTQYPNARLANDGNFYVTDANGKFRKVEPNQ